MWWPATECRHSFCSQASSPAPQKAPLNCPHSLQCSSTCGSQWSERDPYRTRQRYWVVRGQSLIRAIIHRCTTCKKHEGAPIVGPPPPPLPEFRFKENPAFTYTGVDFAGPLSVRKGSSGGSRKVWICLFTCLVT